MVLKIHFVFVSCLSNFQLRIVYIEAVTSRISCFIWNLLIIKVSLLTNTHIIISLFAYFYIFNYCHHMSLQISVAIPLLNEEESLLELTQWIDKVMKANNFSEPSRS